MKFAAAAALGSSGRLRVLISGSSGGLGRHVAAEVMAAGHSVRGIDVSPPPPDAGWEHVAADLAELAAALQLVRDCDAVVHIAAIPRPTGRAPGEVFSANVAACFNVVEAAVLSGVRRFVYASSFSVLGYPFAPRFVAPLFLPIDERHPVGPQDAYGLSKWLGEEIVDAAVRRGAFSAVSLRMPWIQSADSFFREVGPRRESPEAVRDLWSYLDVADAACGFRLALERQGEGHLRAYLAAADTYLDQPTAEALARDLPGVPLVKPLDGHAGLIDWAHARETLGFTPGRSWRDYRAEQEGEQT